MDERSFLHDGERLLCSMRASPAVLIRGLLRGLIEALVTGSVLLAVLAGIVIVGLQGALPVWAVVLCYLVAYVSVAWLRWRSWAHARFRLTSERILVQDPTALMHGELRTLKWVQYQESHTGHRGALDLVFRARPICIRFGTADAQRELCFPSVAYSQDLKHYLDKVDSAVRRGESATVSSFVAKPRGKRDTE